MPNVTTPQTDRAILEVTDLKQWAYCPRVVYYRYCLPRIRPVTYSMRAGIAAHDDIADLEERRSLHAYGLTTGERQYDVPIISQKLGLSGRIDLVIRIDTTEAVVVDFKLSEGDGRAHFKLQLAAYALLLMEAWNVTVKRGFIYHIPDKRVEAISITPGLLAKAQTTIAAVQAAIVSEMMPAPPSTAARCVACEFRRFCNDML